MDKKQVIIRLVLSVFIIPLVIAFIAHLAGFINPGLFGGITMLAGAGYFLYWAKSNRADDHTEQPTKDAP
jgi:hypothetical protein